MGGLHWRRVCHGLCAGRGAGRRSHSAAGSGLPGLLRRPLVLQRWLGGRHHLGSWTSEPPRWRWRRRRAPGRRPTVT